MNIAITELKKLQEEKMAAYEKFRERSKELFGNVAKQIFIDYPEISAFSWTQYTPYFNDGDECVFSAHTDYPTLTLVSGDDKDEFTNSSYKINGIAEKDQPYAKGGRAILELLNQFDDDDFKDMFGNHVKVIVSASGVEVEDYEHD